MERDRFLHALTRCLEQGEPTVHAVARMLSRQGAAS